MTSGIVVSLAVTVLIALMLIQVPVAFALLTAGTLGILFLEGLDIASATLARLPYETSARYVLVVIPMFIAMGVFAKNGRIAEDVFALANRALKKVRAGLPLATIGACATFAAISGSSVATVAALGPICVREMRRHGFSRELASGVVGAAGTLGVLIPPSVILVVYGLITMESIGALMIAGILPGLVTAVVYAAAITIRIYFGGGVATDTAGPLGSEQDDIDRTCGTDERPVSFGALLRVLVLFTAVIGGIYTGMTTVTEAAALGAGLAFSFFLVDVFKTGGPELARLGPALDETISTTGMIFALLIGASIFTYFLVSSGVPDAFTAFVLNLEAPPALIVAALLVAFIPLGMFLDGLSMMLIAVPLAYPIVTELGYDGIWFGILVVKAIELGLITPPFGLNAFVVSGSISDVSLETAFRGLLWFVPVDIAVVVILFLFPEITLWLPQMMS